MQASPESDVEYLEELESRLYSQVFHSTAGYEEFPDISKLTEVNCEVPLQTVRNYRYFMIPNLSKDIPSPSSTFIPLVNHEPSIESKEKFDGPFIQNNISITPTSATVVTDSNCDNIVQNNITVNQFTLPLIVQSDYPDNGQMLNPCTNGQYINPWSNNFSNIFYESPKHAETDRNKQFRRKRNRSRRRGKKESNSTVESSRTIARVEVITLSDESSNECVLVEDIEPKNRVSTEFPKKHEENSGFKKPESDDDIIYIPPSPPEVINIDIDESEESASTLNRMQSKLSAENNLIHREYNISNPIETSASNDFLDTASVDSLSKFNFGLHGVDFNNQNDFVRPPNPEVVPVESCETESSCSTNEHSRDFKNTVKTIVFNEVEFPKEDIFSEKNLESFKTFITPQRNSKSKTDFNEDRSQKMSQKNKKVVDTSNSDSSTESDYEEPVMRNKSSQNIELNKMLPILSPMVSENEQVLNNKDNQKKITQSGFHSSKRKSGEMDEFISSRKSKKKTKCRKSDIPLELTKSTAVSDNVKPRKKKRTSEKEEVSLSNNEETTYISQTSQQTVRIKSKKRKKSEVISAPVDNKDKSKKKKKKRDTIACANQLEPVLNTSGDDNENVHVENETKETELDDKKSKVASSTFEQNNMETIHIEDFVVVDSIDNDLSGVLTVDEASTIDIDKLVLDYEYDPKVMEKDLNSDVTLEFTKTTEVSDNEKPRKKKKTSGKEEVPLFASTPKRKTLSESKSNTEETTEVFETSEQLVEIRSNKRKKRFEPISRTLCNKKSKKKKKKRDPIECATQLELGLITSGDDNENVYVEIETEEAQLDDNISKEASSKLEQNNTEPIAIKDLQIIDSIHNLSELITIDEASVTDIEVVDSDIEDNSNEAVVENDLQLANCSTISQPLISPAVITNHSSNTEIQLKRHRNFDKPFNMDDILRAQSDDPDKWQVSFKDRASYLNMGRGRGPRCNKCREIGHTAIRCTEKPDEPACILCGIRGHEESRCSVKMCNQCGRHSDYNVKYCRSCFTIRDTECRLCHMPGHLAKYCPDLWRRYHLTTTEGPIVVAEGSSLKPKGQQWCCGCAGRGHLEHQCGYHRREYPPTTPDIFSYEDVYSQNENPPKPADTIIVAASSRELIPSPPPPPTIVPASSREPVPSPPVPSPPPPPTISGGSDSITVYPGPSMQQTSQNSPSFIPLSLEGSSNVDQEKPHDVACSSSFSNRVFNPYALQNDQNDKVLDKMELNFDNITVPQEVREWERLHDFNSIRNIIMTMPEPYLIDYIGRNMHELETNVISYDPQELKRIFFMCEYGNKKNVSKQNIRGYNRTKYRKLNMFIFGLHGFRDGKLHTNYLKRFLSNPSEKLDGIKRRSLLSSYNYIFGGDKHPTVNYLKIINMIKGTYFGKRKNKLYYVHKYFGE